MGAFSTPNPSPAAAPPPPDVFTALSACLRAYSVFLPRPETCSLEPLYIVELKQTVDRKDRPIPLNISLLGIAERVLQIRQSNHPTRITDSHTLLDSCKLFITKLIFSRSSPDGEAAYGAWTQLRWDLARNVASREEVLHNVAKVSTNSLRKYGAALTYPPSIAVGAEHVSEKSFESTIRLEDVSVRSYTGENLDFFLATYPRLLYEVLLLYQLPQTAVPNGGDRSLLAIVRTQFTGKLSVIVEGLKQRKGLLGLLSGAVSLGLKCGRADHMRRENILRGVLGLYLIVIPVERIDESNWRFYPSFPVSGREIDGNEEESAENDHLFQAKNWAEKKEGAGLLNEDEYTEIHISSCKSEFAHAQYLLAVHLRDYIGPNKEDDSTQKKRLEMSSQILRSAAEGGSQLAMTELAVNYRRGLGVEKSVDYAEQLESAAQEEIELPNPPQKGDQGDLGNQTGDTMCDASERNWIVKPRAREEDVPEVRIRMKRALPSGRFGRKQNVWVEGVGGLLETQTWWMEDALPQMSVLTPEERFGESSTNDEMAVHMTKIVQEGDPVQVTLHGYHTCVIPGTNESLKVYSLTNETNEWGALSCRERAVHIDQECADDTDYRYVFATPSRSSIFQDYVSRDTSGINITFVAGVEERGEGIQEDYSFDSQGFDPFRFAVEGCLPGMGEGSRSAKRFKRAFWHDRVWLFAKRGQVVLQSESWRYLRYGYYFVLDDAVESQLYAMVDGAGAKLYVYDARRDTFMRIHEYSYFVIKVSLCAGMPQRRQQSISKRAVRLREVCNKAAVMDAKIVKSEIISIMDPGSRSDGRRKGERDEQRATLLRPSGLEKGRIGSSNEHLKDAVVGEGHVASGNPVSERLGRKGDVLYEEPALEMTISQMTTPGVTK